MLPNDSYTVTVFVETRRVKLNSGVFSSKIPLTALAMITLSLGYTLGFGSSENMVRIN